MRRTKHEKEEEPGSLSQQNQCEVGAQNNPPLPSTSRVSTRKTPSAEEGAATKLQFEFRKMYVEDHKSTIYCVQFNHFIDGKSIFACVAKNRVSIYSCQKDGSLKFENAFQDSEETEVFFTCAWSCQMMRVKIPKPGGKLGDEVEVERLEPILAVAGYRGVIRILHATATASPYFLPTSWTVHSGEIYELKYHPSKLELLLSASKDHTIRLWNSRTHALIACFGSGEGHRDSVLSVDFNHLGDTIVSCGMDHAIKFWTLNDPVLLETIEQSNSWDGARPFPTFMQHLPQHSTRAVHNAYVDCIFWFNRLLISKSNDGILKFWQPDLKSENKLGPFKEICCANCNVWFLKFSMFVGSKHKVLALGNTTGKVFVWNLNVPYPNQIKSFTLTHPKCTTTIRHTALSADASILIAVGDDGSIWRWDRTSE